MIVVDASALLEMVLRTETAEAIAERLLPHSKEIHAPHLVDVEVTQVVRRWTMHRLIEERRGQRAINSLPSYPIRRHAHGPFLPRIWDLRTNLSAYDAIYVALAETLGASLLTRDRRLARACEGLVAVDLV